MAGDGRRDEEDEYLELSHLRVDLNREEVRGVGFSLAFWLYLSSSARPSSVILRQVPLEREDGAPFLALSEENRLTLFPAMFLHKEAPSSDSSFPWTDLPHISAAMECPLEKWFHIGCEVAADTVHLHLDGKLVGEKFLSSISENGHDHGDLKRIMLAGNDGSDGKLHGYVYCVRVLPLSASIAEQLVKNPPVKLSLDGSCLSDGIEVGGDGIWSIVGGKASCRRNFSLEVVLLDALGQSAQKEMEIVASLIYADNGAPVEKTRDDAEAPLLTSYDGLEFPSTDKPVILLRGHATFKLKISQLSSKSDNRLFRVCFRATHAQRFPFFEAFTPSIRCISRNRCVRTPVSGKRLSSASALLGTDHSSGANGGIVCHGNWSESKCSSLSKRLKVGHDKLPMETDTNGILKQNGKAFNTSLELKFQNNEGTDCAPSDSESTDARTESTRTGDAVNLISDAIIFRYCLEGTFERSTLLKEIIISASNHDIEKFAEQICLYTGCYHHRYQILISKQLVEEGSDTWNSIAGNKHRVLWTDVIPEIDRRFMSIACSSSRGLSVQDLEVLRRIAGCGEEMARENFDNIWYWLYPVALALAKVQLNEMWNCTSARWIEGLITREEAENSLKDARVLQKPGTFVLRFPTSRSWPHPDAGSLVITYLGTDSTLHHKLLSLDYSCDDNSKMHSRPLKDLLLEEPELSQPGRVTREAMTFA